VAMSDDVTIWSKVAVGAAGVCTALIGVVWGDAQRRVRKLEESKADKAEFERTRDHVDELYKRDDQIRETMAEGFSELKDLIHQKHNDLLQQLFDHLKAQR
jgi:hypothetical protein